MKINNIFQHCYALASGTNWREPPALGLTSIAASKAVNMTTKMLSASARGACVCLRGDMFAVMFNTADTAEGVVCRRLCTCVWCVDKSIFYGLSVMEIFSNNPFLSCIILLLSDIACKI